MYKNVRKRPMSSCIPCYTKKQKCNREYPCNHCARRRRPEDCAYHTNQTHPNVVLPTTRRPSSQSTQSEKEHSSSASDSVRTSIDWSARHSPALTSLSNASTSIAFPPTQSSIESSLTAFGYAEDSKINALALIKKGWAEERYSFDHDPLISPDAAREVQLNIERLPDRQILDFLVRYFVAEVNWIDQLIHSPWFLGHYQRWWTVEHLHRVLDVEFAVLILRISSYASQHLPSRSYTIDKVRGVPLSDIRSKCDDIANTLSSICNKFDRRGSLFRVQHCVFLGLSCHHEGRTDEFWESFTRAVLVTQGLRMQTKTTNVKDGTGDFEMEMQRRTVCSLYAWDNLLSRQLDCVSLFPDRLRPEDMPQIHLAVSGRMELGPGAPDDFTGRLQQARLSDFWRSFGGNPRPNEYDMMAMEERYEKFCSDYLPQIPSCFGLLPDKTWDERITKLPLQRQLLHIAIYDSLCWHFRPLILRDPKDMQGLPTYKQVLMISQRQALAMAALHTLDGVNKLHTMLGSGHVKLPQLIFYTFEAAVVLAFLCIEPHFPENNLDGENQSSTPKAGRLDPLRIGIIKLTRAECLQALNDALNRLHMLAEVSTVAGAGAQTLTRLLRKVSGQDTWSKDMTIDWFNMESSDARTMEEFLCSLTAPHDISHSWDAMATDFQITH